MAQRPAHRPKNSAHITPQASHIDTVADVPQKPLPPAIAILVDAATAYSSDNLQHLINALSNLGPSLAAHPRVLDLLLGYLKERVPFTNAQSEKCSEIALRGIRTVIDKQEVAAMTSTNNNNTFLAQSLAQSWPDIWFWMNFKNDPDTSITLERLRLAVDIINGVLSRFPHGSADQAIRSTPGVCSIAADVWMQPHDQMSTKETFMQDCYTCCGVLLHLATFKPASAGCMYDTPVARRRTTFMLLKTIQISAKVDLSLTSLMMLLAKQLVDTSPELGDILLSWDSIGIVCRVLALRSSQTLQTSQLATDIFGTFLFSSLHYLFSEMSRRGNHTHIIRAVRAGLIPSLLRCASLKVDGLEERVLSTLQLLTEHTVYSSFLRACQVALEDPVVPSLEGRVPEKHAFWEKWTAFRTLHRQRLALKVQLYELDMCVCNSDKCSNRAVPRYYRICSGCLDVQYCSKACQTYSWKQGGHRDHCKIVSQSRAEGTRSGISIQDRIFFIWIAIFRLAAHIESRQIDQTDPLLAEIAKSVAKDPPRNIMINLASNPTTFDTDVSSKIALSPTEPTEKYRVYSGDRTTVLRPESLATQVNIFLVVPYGGRTYTTACIQYIRNEVARLIFARGAPKPTV